MTGQVFALASGKGGVGRTTGAINLAVELRMRDVSVCLVDADLGMPNLGTQLSIEADQTIHDVLAGRTSLEDAIVERAAGFGILVGDRSLPSAGDIDPGQLGFLCETLREDYEYVLLDTGSGVSYETIYPLTLADEVILVTTDEPAAVDDTVRTAEIARKQGCSIYGVYVSRTDGAADAKAIADRLGTVLLGTVPTDPVVIESTEAGKPLALHAPESAPRHAYQSIVSALLNPASNDDTPPTVDTAA